MAATAASGTTVLTAGVNGGRFDFDDGGTYCGGWEEGKAHGHGVCTGPKGQGEYSGSWHYGFEVSGIYTWPSGSLYEGHWQNGKRHGLGVESRGKWLYRGEWTQGFKGRYGVRQSLTTPAKYEGTWANGLQDGYGSETYADGGTYQGQWLRGMRHGYGVRTSAAFGIASHSKGADGGGRRPSLSSLQQGGMEDATAAAGSARSGVLPNGTKNGMSGGEEVRGGFVLKSRSDEAPVRRRSLVERSGMKHLMQGLKIRKQRSTGDLDRKGVMASIRSTGSTSSWMSSESNYAGASVLSEGSQASFIVEDEMLDANVTETYMGEWKNDKRCGFGISERSDGLKYEGEWFNNRKYGYGVTTFKDGTREEGKYKNNILITSNKKKHLFLIRSAKFRERIESAVSASQRASKIALQKADIAISRTATARGKAEQADYAAVCAKEDSTEARACAQQFAPDFISTGGMGTLETEIPANFNQPAGGGELGLPAHQPPGQLGAKIPTSLDIPGPGKAGPGPPSPRGGPGPPPALPGGKAPPLASSTAPQQQMQSDASKPFANHIGAVQQPTGPGPSSMMMSNSNRPNNIAPAGGGAAGTPQAAAAAALPPPPANNIKSKPSLVLPPPSAMDQPSPVNSLPAVGFPRNNPAAVGGQKLSMSVPTPGEGPSARPSTVNPPVKSDISQRPSQIGAAPPLISAPPPRSDINKVPSFPEPAVLRQPASLQINEPPMQNRGRTPTRQERIAALGGGMHDAVSPAPASIQGGGGNQVSQAGGYNFQKIMDDRFEHYKRPPSRERSADRFGPGSRQGSRQHLAGGGGRDTSRDRYSGSASSTLQRPQSRQRTPMAANANPAENHNSVVVNSDSMMKPAGATGLDSLNVDGLSAPAAGAVTGNGSVNALVADFRLPPEDQLRYRGVQQEIPHFGAPPKRTESLYMKPPVESQTTTFKPIGGSALQRKKSLPDVAALPTVTVKSGTQVITREEISVLSSARRELMRRQVEEAERYSANPILYIFNPQIRDWFSRQQLMLVVLFVNVTLAIMFFKLLT